MFGVLVADVLVNHYPTLYSDAGVFGDARAGRTPAATTTELASELTTVDKVSAGHGVRRRSGRQSAHRQHY